MVVHTAFRCLFLFESQYIALAAPLVEVRCLSSPCTAARMLCKLLMLLYIGDCHKLILNKSIRRFLRACSEVTLKREECEKPWCLTDNALPCDTPQLAAGRLH